MKLGLLVIVVVAVWFNAAGTALADNPFAPPLGAGPFMSACESVGGTCECEGATKTCTYFVVTPFAESHQLGSSGQSWTISGTTTDTYVVIWSGPIDITGPELTEEGEPVVTSCVNQRGQQIDLRSRFCQLP